MGSRGAEIREVRLVSDTVGSRGAEIRHLGTPQRLVSDTVGSRGAEIREVR